MKLVILYHLHCDTVLGRIGNRMDDREGWCREVWVGNTLFTLMDLWWDVPLQDPLFCRVPPLRSSRLHGLTSVPGTTCRLGQFGSLLTSGLTVD